MKKMIFVSTGRCGTKRLSQILNDHLPSSFSVAHQLSRSRAVNIIGNALKDFQIFNRIKTISYTWLLAECPSNRYLILTDPLSSMIIPDHFISAEDVAIVHIVREPMAYAQSIYRLSRSRGKSFIAHCFVPFWQPGLIPFENLIRKDVIDRYARICEWKNSYFQIKYSISPNYRQVSMTEIFQTNIVEQLIYSFFGLRVSIPASEWSRKSN